MLRLNKWILVAAYRDPVSVLDIPSPQHIRSTTETGQARRTLGGRGTWKRDSSSSETFWTQTMRKNSIMAIMTSRMPSAMKTGHVGMKSAMAAQMNDPSASTYSG
eukprot:517744-Rhodomonas_salina.2